MSDGDLLADKLCAAVFGKHFRLCEVLLVLKADPDRPSFNGLAAIHLAVGLEFDSVDFLRLLLQYGSDPNVRSLSDAITPVHLSAMLGRAVQLALLLDSGGDPDLLDSNGMTAFDYGWHNLKVKKVLLRYLRSGQDLSSDEEDRLSDSPIPYNSRKCTKSFVRKACENCHKSPVRLSITEINSRQHKSCHCKRRHNFSHPMSSKLKSWYLNKMTNCKNALINNLAKSLHTTPENLKNASPFSKQKARESLNSPAQTEKRDYYMDAEVSTKASPREKLTLFKRFSPKADINVENLKNKSEESDSSLSDASWSTTDSCSSKESGERVLNMPLRESDVEMLTCLNGEVLGLKKSATLDVSSPNHPFIVAKIERSKTSSSSSSSGRNSLLDKTIPESVFHSSADFDARESLARQMSALQLSQGSVLNNKVPLKSSVPDSNLMTSYKNNLMKEKSTNSDKLFGSSFGSTPSSGSDIDLQNMRGDQTETPISSRRKYKCPRSSEERSFISCDKVTPKSSSLFAENKPRSHGTSDRCSPPEQNNSYCSYKKRSSCSRRQMKNKENSRNRVVTDEFPAHDESRSRESRCKKRSQEGSLNTSAILQSMENTRENDSRCCSRNSKSSGKQVKFSQEENSMIADETFGDNEFSDSDEDCSFRTPQTSRANETNKRERMTHYRTIFNNGCTDDNSEFYQADEFVFIERRIVPKINSSLLTNDADASQNTSALLSCSDWKSCRSQSNRSSASNQSGVTSSVFDKTNGSDKPKSPPSPSEKKRNSTDLVVRDDLQSLSNEEIFIRLKASGCAAGPVTDSTRNTYLKILSGLEGTSSLKKVAIETQRERLLTRENKDFSDNKSDFPALLCEYLSDKNGPLLDLECEEEMMCSLFDDTKRSWREGRRKNCFNYLLLDPRVTRNLLHRSKALTDMETFRIFVSAIFYIGKGQNSRPFAHFSQALRHQNSDKQVTPPEKVQHILDIWNCGMGVVSLQCFQGCIAAEAYTREALLIQALGLSRLTNQRRGDCYGVTASWNTSRREKLGIFLLVKAMKIFLQEGERQIRPADF